MNPLPQSLESERAVLGAMMLPGAPIPEICETVRPEDFYRDAHRKIFEAAIDLSRRSEPVDLLTVPEALKLRGELGDVGGYTYIAELTDAAFTAVNTTYYAKIIRETALLRVIMQTGLEIARRASEGPGDVQAFADEVEAMIFAAVERRSTRQAIRVGETSLEYFRELEARAEQKGSITGLATGFIDFDRMTSGLQESDLVVLAARPSMGKSALALNIAENVAMGDAPRGVLVFSLEMAFSQLRERMWSGQSRIELQRLRSGYIRQSEWPLIVEASKRIDPAPIYVDDTPAITPAELRARARRMAADKRVGLGLVIVDYLQLMRSPEKSRSREQEIAEVSRSLKALAKELRVPVLALAQLNREVESRNPPIPRMSDLRDSGQIEQDADVIAFLYREDAYQRDESKHTGRAELIVDKQRNGPTGVVHLSFTKQLTRFENLEHGGAA